MAKPSIEQNYHLMPAIYSCYDVFLGIHSPLCDFVYCLLQVGCSLVPHTSFMVCQHQYLIIQHSHPYQVVIDPIWEEAHKLFLLSLIAKCGSFAAGIGNPVGYLGTYLLVISVSHCNGQKYVFGGR